MDINKYYKFISKPYLPALVVSVILFITVFLPWLSVKIGYGFGSVSANGTHDWGVLTLLMSIAGVGLSFNDIQKMRAIGLLGAGILALLGVIIYWINLSGASIGFGLIIALLASLGLTYIGYMDYRKINPPDEPAQPTTPSPQQ